MVLILLLLDYVSLVLKVVTNMHQLLTYALSTSISVSVGVDSAIQYSADLIGPTYRAVTTTPLGLALIVHKMVTL